MKSPRPAGAPVDMKRMSGWLDDFSNYRHAITERRVERWLAQFDLPDIDLAARVLDCVDFVPNERIAASFRSALNDLPGWHRKASQRRGKWRFAAFSSSAGESGDAMLQKFRHANNLASSSHHSLFVHRSELLGSGLANGDSIVFVDDFSGTGTQVTKAWPMLSELLPEGPDVYLLLVAATKMAVQRIERETSLIVRPDIVLAERDAVFSDACRHFTPEEKGVLKRYCERAGPRSAEEFAESGYVIVFGHTCPNNTIPILHAQAGDWEGLFRRYD